MWLEAVLPASRGSLLLEEESSDSGASNLRIAPFSLSLPSISMAVRMRSLTSAFHTCAGDPPRIYKNCFGCVCVTSALSPSTCLSDISPLTIEQFSISPPPADPEWLKRKQQAKFREELPL